MPLLELLIARRGDLLARWNQWVREEVTAADMGTGELVDSMPLFIDALIESIASSRESVREGSATGRSSARVHGGERLRLGFDVTAVVREYNLLWRAILELAHAEHETLPIAEMQLVCDIIGNAQAEAVGEYQRERDQEQGRQAAQHLSFLAHELRTPLSATLNAFALARMHVAAEANRYLAIIDRGFKRLMEVLDNSLIAGQVRTGTVPLLADVDLSVCVHEIVAENAANAEHRGMSLQADVPAALPLRADRRLLMSVLSNLISNAIKFSRPKSTIAVRAHQAHAMTVVEVEDGCGGLPPDKVSAIFDPHVQIGADRSGFGLGLAIAKQAAEAHGGTLQVQNVEGRGCCFRMELPSGA
jgi:signal transduction histidine kinase